jgi:hypothetical protein
MVGVAVAVYTTLRSSTGIFNWQGCEHRDAVDDALHPAVNIATRLSRQAHELLRSQRGAEKIWRRYDGEPEQTRHSARRRARNAKRDDYLSHRFVAAFHLSPPGEVKCVIRRDPGEACPTRPHPLLGPSHANFAAMASIR